MRLRIVASETLHGLRRNLGAVVCVVIACGVAAFGVEAALLVHQQTGLVGDRWYLRVTSVVSIALAVIMAVCWLLLIGGLVRQATASRRRQLAIMRHAGATAGTLYLPYLIQCVLASLIGAAAGVVAAWAVVRDGITPHLRGTVSVVGVGDVWRIAPWVGLVALVLGAVGSWLSLRRHLRV